MTLTFDPQDRIIRIGKQFTTVTLDMQDNNKLIPLMQEKQIKTEEFAENCNNFLSHINSVNFILPQKCKFVKQYASTPYGQHFMFIIEEPPTIRTLKINLYMEAPLARLKAENKLIEYGYQDFELKPYGVPYLFSVSLPYIIHMLTLSLQPDTQPHFEHYLFYRLSPLQSTFDYLLRPNLPNIDGGYRVCPGDYEITETTIPGMVNQYLLHFWSSMFNKDYTTHYTSYADDEIITDFMQWHYHSKVDSKCIFKVNWQQIENLDKQMRRMQSSQGFGEQYYINVDTLYDLASGLKITINKNKPKIGFTNWIDSLWIDRHILTIGDSINLNKKKFYIKDFLKGTNQDAFIVLESEKGKVVSLKDTPKLRQLFLKYIHSSNSIEDIVINGETYTKGDIAILSVGNKEQHVIVESFSKSKLGKLLLTTSNGKKYFVENIQIQKFNKNKIIVGGITFETGKVYLALEKYPTFVSSYKQLEFQEATFDFGEVRLQFHQSDRRGRITFSPYDISKNDMVPIEQANTTIQPKIFAFSNLFQCQNGFLVYGNHYYMKTSDSLTEVDFSQICNYVTENEFHIPTTKPFIVGERVVVASWDSPFEMTERRAITKFLIDKEKEIIYMETTNGESTKIDPIVVHDKILYGKFKHIETEYDGLKSGDVIRPRFSGISCFPKKNNYRIIGFIDSGIENYKMALMSNCCTLWSVQIKEDFESAPNINVAEPTVDKIKFQDLDMFNRGVDGYQSEDAVLLYDNNHAGLRVYRISSMRLNNEYALSSTPESFLRFGFIFPRKNQLNESVTAKLGVLNGDYTIKFFDNTNNQIRHRMTFDRRLFKNV